MPVPIENIAGRKFGRWTVIAKGSRTNAGRQRWKCRCECGTEREVTHGMLTFGESRSCGCLSRDIQRSRHLTHGMTGTPEYDAWLNMRSRCYDKSCRMYRRYGGRGIRVCKKWLNNFAAFLRDMGTRPSPEHSIDRRNNDGNYTPSNCRWATRSEQALNTSRTRLLAVGDVRLPLSVWAERLGVKSYVISKRLSRGWPVDMALTAPCGTRP